MADDGEQYAGGGQSLQRGKSVEELARDFDKTQVEELPVVLGFSARLNMLWDLRLHRSFGTL